MITVEYDSGLDMVFSKMQMKAFIRVFGAGWSTELLKASVNRSPAMQQQPATNIWKVTEMETQISLWCIGKLMEKAGCWA